MKPSKRLPAVLLLFLAFPAAFLCLLHVFPSKAIPSAPFQIEISQPHIAQTPKQLTESGAPPAAEQTENRLQFTISILNTTDRDYRNTWFEARLNAEAAPFIASRIVTYTSDPFYVTTPEKATASQNSGLTITGFEHTWNFLLTSPEDLLAYYHKTPGEITTALQSIHIQIHWDGGVQEQTIPLTLSDAAPR